MRPISTRFVVTAFLAITTLMMVPAAHAATFVVPTDEELIGKAKAIVSGVVIASHPRFTERGEIETVHTFLINEVFKGAVHFDRIEIVEWGGRIGSVWMAASGAPVYETGKEYVVFLTENRDRNWTTVDLCLGRFEFVRDLLLRESDEIFGWDTDGGVWREPRRRADGFMQHIRLIGAGKDAEATYFEGETRGRRVQPLSHPATIVPHTNLDFVGASNIGLASWNGHSGSTITYQMSGTPASGNTKSVFDSEDRFIEDDPNGDIPGTFTGSGVVATAFYGGTTSTQPYLGDQYANITGSDIVTQNGLSSANFTQERFNTTMVHEAGHTLGFRHANQNASGGACPGSLPCSSSAIMNSSVVGGLNGALQAWDSDAANEAYGNGTAQAGFTGVHYVGTFSGDPNPTRRFDTSAKPWHLAETGCIVVTITTQPASTSIAFGSSTTLSVVAAGDSPTYQWYMGTSGNTSGGVIGTSSMLNTGALTSTTSYWVRVSNSCPSSVDSVTATVTVGSCDSPVINTQPQDTTITSGSSTTLSVSATGGSLTYQWYRGTAPDQSNPVGTNSPNFNTGILTSTTSFWVRVSGACGSPVNSSTATVTVNQASCTPPSISTQPQNKNITQGQTTNLSVGVTGTGPFLYQWFTGNPPDMSNPTGQTTSSIQVSPAVTTNYWVRVIGQCDPAANSNAATVTVTADSCPDVTVQNPTATKQPNGTYLLDVIASSGNTVLTYQWFQGAVPGIGDFVGAGRQILVPAPTVPTSYWVRVINDCDKTANSPTVVTIAPCDLPVIDTEPGDQSILNGASATLTFAFTSATPATVRWYRGIAPDKTNEVGIGTSFNTGPLTATTQYWASITNSCGEKFTRTLTVTVGTACTAPQITSVSPPQTKLKNETVTVNVVATGTETLHYQWFEGVQGDISNPVGTDSATFTSAPLDDSTKFWVQVSNACGNAFSTAIQVTVLKPRVRAVRH